ncbi:unnamed protein product [Tuber aestivum]|uniref:Uncharacterized protein n=1 Tax=Tuber aestivum TaxID=59557 RepID=A0A292PU67_9PEZI|nr:unnamed protein product [Tuber aestivum]
MFYPLLLILLCLFSLFVGYRFLFYSHALGILGIPFELYPGSGSLTPCSENSEGAGTPESTSTRDPTDDSVGITSSTGLACLLFVSIL